MRLGRPGEKLGKKILSGNIYKANNAFTSDNNEIHVAPSSFVMFFPAIYIAPIPSQSPLTAEESGFFLEAR